MKAIEIFVETLKVILLGIIEGITEWLPVSSTGHMILAEEFLHLESMSEAFYNMFLYVIQLGAILAVVVLFFRRLNPFSKAKAPEERSRTWRLWGLVLIGVLPAAAIGIPLDGWLEDHVFVPGVRAYVVAAALIVYGVLFIIIERARRAKEPTTCDIENLSWRHALLIGVFQVLSIIPGTSRSGSTIIGALTLGVSRAAAAEYSFFMAIPIMLGVSVLKIGKFALNALDGEAGYAVTGIDVAMLAVGFVVAFLVSLAVIRFLMDFVRRRNFEPFGWYRIALGAVVLLYFLIFA